MLVTADQPWRIGKNYLDQAMTLATIDRVVHHATILEMNVDGYRRKEAVDKAIDDVRRQRNDQGFVMIVAPRQSNHPSTK